MLMFLRQQKGQDCLTFSLIFWAILTKYCLFLGGTEVIHDEHLSANVLFDMDGHVHSLLADMARGNLPRETDASQHLLPYRSQ